MSGFRTDQVVDRLCLDVFSVVRSKVSSKTHIDNRRFSEFIRTIEQVDPATYGHRLRDRRVLMIEAAYDEVIPADNARALHASIGEQARIVWLNSGHYTAIWYLPREIIRLERFFNVR